MVSIYKKRVLIPVQGNKTIEEMIGIKSNNTKEYSVAHMVMPPAWSESPHKTLYNEIVIIISGELTIKEKYKIYKVNSGEVAWIKPSESIEFLNETLTDCEYWAICHPAFSADLIETNI